MTNDGQKRCLHGRPASTRPAPEHGAGWLELLSPEDCPLCPDGQVLSTFRPGDWQKGPAEAQGEPEELEAQGVEAQAEESTAAPAASEAASLEEEEEDDPPPLGVLEDLAERVEMLETIAGASLTRARGFLDRIELLERYEKNAAGRAETVEALEAMGARVTALEGLEELAAAIADGVAALDQAEELEAQERADLLEQVRSPRGEAMPTCFRCGHELGKAATVEEAGVGRRHVDGSPACGVLPARTRVIIESPFAGAAGAVAYAHRALLDSLERGEAPIASHLLYTQVLDDGTPRERYLGMSAGWSWLPVAEVVAVYADLGITDGMRAGIVRAEAAGVRVEVRRLDAEDFADAT